MTTILRTIPRRGRSAAPPPTAQLRDLRARAELRAIRAAPERILAWLVLRAEGEPPGVTLDRSWTAVAAEIGLTREALYRALSRLEAQGRISRAAGRVTLGR